MGQDLTDIRLRLIELQTEELGKAMDSKLDQVLAELSILGIQFDGLTSATASNEDRISVLERNQKNILTRLEALERKQ